MNKDNEINLLIEELISVNESIDGNIEIPKDYDEKRKLLRALMNIQSPVQLSEEFYLLQDKILSEETESKDIVSADEIKAISDDPSDLGSKLALWQGDITCLEVDGIVNAANSQILGCFIPLHNCIDNQIHSAAGFQLRMDCHEIMEKQGHEEEIGKAKITSAYNLPSKYVLHTVGPAIPYGSKPNDMEIKGLRDCYESCLELADENGLKSIAFCSISTGVFNFPKEEACKIAIKAVKDYLKSHKDTNIEKVIFNSFSDNATEIYMKYLGKI